MPWSPPLEDKYFIVGRKIFVRDPVSYPKTGIHPGVDYATYGNVDVNALACCDGEIVYYSDRFSNIGKIIGNHVALYSKIINRSFLYCHLRDAKMAVLSKIGPIEGGWALGVVGQTGTSANGVHLHLECYSGIYTKEIRERAIQSESSVRKYCLDADQVIRSNIFASRFNASIVMINN